jgi:hypothetical protein
MTPRPTTSPISAEKGLSAASYPVALTVTDQSPAGAISPNSPRASGCTRAIGSPPDLALSSTSASPVASPSPNFSRRTCPLIAAGACWPGGAPGSQGLVAAMSLQPAMSRPRKPKCTALMGR